MQLDDRHGSLVRGRLSFPCVVVQPHTQYCYNQSGLHIPYVLCLSAIGTRQGYMWIRLKNEKTRGGAK